ncbi:1170_t:CDS:1, partial [Ambispora leptoticha]
KSTFISSSERQSSASADRKGDGRLRRRPDIMFVMKRGKKNYELLYAECSRLTCTTRKEKNDGVKLWRETNDGMYWTRKSCKPDKDEFGIIGVQVAGKKLRLSILIRDMSEVHRHYHLHESEIPIQQSAPSIVTKFVETLLILRNILIVNMTLLHNASLPKSGRLVEDSSTIDSDN